MVFFQHTEGCYAMLGLLLFPSSSSYIPVYENRLSFANLPFAFSLLSPYFRGSWVRWWGGGGSKRNSLRVQARERVIDWIRATIESTLCVELRVRLSATPSSPLPWNIGRRGAFHHTAAIADQIFSLWEGDRILPWNSNWLRRRLWRDICNKGCRSLNYGNSRDLEDSEFFKYIKQKKN